ncbi:hypothetical protein GCM10009785_02340 [Brooklawnia cerclae]|uniref:Uncharacterized protein n=1 Tax=Brooklawnia cerclae TaxID=349934 RepID=A0ABX0SCQ2_9ACTN|nr:hypothetical protein [Brooklawnia cerclae]NIH56172.1 hypothetical protein [Brooklawnia cerclae]
MAHRNPNRLDAAETTELREALGRRPDVLVAAHGPEATAAVLHDVFAVRRPGGWNLVAWVDIRTGSWDYESRRLRWELVDGTKDDVVLTEPGQMPVTFAERVQASIAVQRQVQLPDGLGSVTLVGRRQPGSSDPISWQAQGLGRTDLGNPAIAKHVVGLIGELRREFD